MITRTLQFLTFAILALLYSAQSLAGDTPSCDCSPPFTGTCHCDMNYKTKIHPLQTKNIKFKCTSGVSSGSNIYAVDYNSNAALIASPNSLAIFYACLSSDISSKCSLPVFNSDPTSNHSVKTTKIRCCGDGAGDC
jgi:hypothetical protein